ncbi:OLC1v1008639C1 [Oldenlandia corymbosa var. corymbosa]|uniref:OLC1v1008639C1 n=1 Tax=Oldenlandia corymbosa var. corymbosa TaxID=529605 RepID=A0AAV1DPI0_OLDCO|nr:OLC1v1008639C1 [Oldenlandia corymbosa var. corymbosa]
MVSTRTRPDEGTSRRPGLRSKVVGGSSRVSLGSRRDHRGKEDIGRASQTSDRKSRSRRPSDPREGRNHGSAKHGRSRSRRTSKEAEMSKEPLGRSRPSRSPKRGSHDDRFWKTFAGRFPGFEEQFRKFEDMYYEEKREGPDDSLIFMGEGKVPQGRDLSKERDPKPPPRPEPWVDREAMDLRDSPQEFSAKAMATFLTGATMIWFHNLPPGSVRSYADLGQKLHVRFFSSKRASHTIHDLSSVRQRWNESLGKCYERFTKELMMIDQVDDLVVRVEFVNGLSPFGTGATLRGKLTAKPPATSQKLWETVEKEIRTDESMKRAKEAFGEGEKKAGNRRRRS